ncbi:MAG: hypothetical protein ABJN05_06315 [Sulfitobacter dubius]
MSLMPPEDEEEEKRRGRQIEPERVSFMIALLALWAVASLFAIDFL